MDQDVTQLMQDNLKLVEALHEIASTSEDANTVRVAVAALTTTQTGLSFLQVNPIRM